jgi:gas vesicle protein
VSELLNSDEEKLLEIKGIAATTLEKIYDAVQSFVEKNQNETPEEDVSLKSDSEENENLSEGIEAKGNDSPSPDADPDKLEKVES